MPRRKITWTDDENELVAANLVKIMVDSPERSDGAIFTDAQSGIDNNRRRKIQGFSAGGRITELVKIKLTKLVTDQSLSSYTMPLIRARLARINEVTSGNNNGHAVNGQVAQPTLEELNRDTQKQLDTAKQEVVDLKSQLTALQQEHATIESQLAAATNEITSLRARPGPIDPEVLLATAPTERMLAILFTRFLTSISGERHHLEERLGGVLLGKFDSLGQQLAGERLMIEERLYRMESNLAKNNTLAPAPSIAGTKDDAAYMPMILLAGLLRADFQRLQESLNKSGVRLKNVDLSKPNNISVETHDRLVICSGVPSDIAARLRSRSTKSLTYSGSLEKMGPFIIDLVKKVREEHQ